VKSLPKLLKHLAYSYRKRSGEEVPHYKYVVVIPENTRKTANWKGGEELEFEVNGNTITMRPKKNTQNLRKKARKDS
jgi:AbrB family looped-hinge helix DNA binding protein